jgi:HSP20 family protein
MLPSKVSFNYPTVRLFNDIFDDLFDMSVVNKSGAKTPVHDVIENNKEYVVELLLAGVSKDSISIDIDNDVLTIKAERKEVKDLKYNRKETYFGKYERSFILPDNVDKENIGASLIDGILKLIIPKLEVDTKPSKIKIEIK